MRQWTESALVQIMTCRLNGTKPLSEPMLTYCQLDLKEHISMKFYLKFNFFSCKKNCWARDDLPAIWSAHVTPFSCESSAFCCVIMMWISAFCRVVVLPACYETPVMGCGRCSPSWRPRSVNYQRLGEWIPRYLAQHQSCCPTPANGINFEPGEWTNPCAIFKNTFW